MARDRDTHALNSSAYRLQRRTETMPVILWLLGMPLTLIILLMLLGGL
jgi:hypothetical protein